MDKSISKYTLPHYKSSKSLREEGDFAPSCSGSKTGRLLKISWSAATEWIKMDTCYTCMLGCTFSHFSRNSVIVWQFSGVSVKLNTLAVFLSVF